MVTNHATSEGQIRIINTENGLEESTIKSIHTGENGLVYLGTGVGLSIFDGDNVVNISTGIRQSVVSIIGHGDDSLILVRDNGITIINIHNYGYRESDFSEKHVDKILSCAKAGQYIFCTTSERLGRFDLKTLKYKPLNNIEGLDKEVTFTSKSSILFSDFSKLLYVAHNRGLSAYQIEGENLSLIEKSLPWDSARCGNLSQLNNKFCYKAPGRRLIIYDEEKGNHETYSIASVYSALMKDKFVYSSRNFVFTHTIDTDVIDSFDLGVSHIIYKIIEGQGNNLLIASASGLIIISTKSQKPITETGILPLNSNSEQGLQKKYRYLNSLFFNTKDGMIAYDSITGNTEFIPIDKSANILNILSFFPYIEDKLILCGEGGYCGFDTRTRTYFKLKLFSDSSEAIISKSRAITGHYNIKDSFLVMTFYRKPIKYINLKSKTEGTWNGFDKGWFRTVRSIQYDKDGYYWMGANGNDGLMYYNFKTDRGYYIKAAEFTKAGNNSALINQIMPYNGMLYLSTADGVVRYDIKNKTLTQLSVDGKPYHDQIYASAIIKGRLYFSSRNHLCTLGEDGNLLKLQYYPNYAGTGIPFEARGSIFLTAGRNIYKFQIPDINRHPEVFISHIGNQSKWINATEMKQLSFPYGSGSLQIFFGNSHLKSFKNELRVYYRFSGDKEWQLLNGSSLQTGNLNYGDHQLSYYSAYWGSKSKIKTLIINIQRPWWASIWFYAALIVATISLSYLLIKLYNRSTEDSRRKKLALILETTENERNRISRDFHDSIGSKLSSIKLITENISAGGDQSLSKQLPPLVDEIITDVRAIISRLSPQPLEMYGLIPAVESLLNGLKKQFPNIRFIFESGKNFPRLKKECEIHIFRIFQELINNSIKHSECTQLNLSISEQNSQVIISVKDNGKWKENEAGHGLINSESRTNIMGGSINIIKSTDKGTEVKIVLSLEACSKPLS